MRRLDYEQESQAYDACKSLRLVAQRWLAIVCKMQLQNYVKITCNFLQKVLAKNTIMVTAAVTVSKKFILES
jgi:invasion protein IalB